MNKLDEQIYLLKQLEDLAIKEAVFAKQVTNEQDRKRFILNGISNVAKIIQEEVPSSLYANDFRYRGYVIALLGQFKDDKEIFKAILTGKE